VLQLLSAVFVFYVVSVAGSIAVALEKLVSSLMVLLFHAWMDRLIGEQIAVVAVFVIAFVVVVVALIAVVVIAIAVIAVELRFVTFPLQPTTFFLCKHPLNPSMCTAQTLVW